MFIFPKKSESPMYLTEYGIVIDENEDSWNVAGGSLSMEFPITTDVNC
jgi:hypothetical protein